MAYKQCAYCGQYSDSKNTSCPSCAAPLSNEVVAEAGNLKDAINTAADTLAASFTQAISNSIAQKPAEPHPSGKVLVNKAVALILLLTLGFFGGHRFYEGKIFTGILYCLTGGCFLFGMIADFCIILSKPFYYPSKRKALTPVSR